MMKKKNYFYAGDRIGVSRFTIPKKDGIFAFASRIKTLLLVPEITSAVDQNGLNEIFYAWSCQNDRQCRFKDINELPPASYMIYSNEKSLLKPIGSLKQWSIMKAKKETIAHTRYLVKDAIERQLVFGMFRFAHF